VLAVLTDSPDPGEAAWRAQFNAMRALARTYFPVVIVSRVTDAVVAAGTVFVERKFIHGNAAVGHIEDIAVDERQQGKKLGLRVIQALTHVSEVSGCYKTILNCSDKNVPFYEKCGFQKKENEMVSLPCCFVRGDEPLADGVVRRPSTRRSGHRRQSFNESLVRHLVNHLWHEALVVPWVGRP
jgi:GNAT superfamily N-acetyltransferase